MLPKASIPVAAPIPLRGTSFTDGDDRGDYESGDLVRAASARLVGDTGEPLARQVKLRGLRTASHVLVIAIHPSHLPDTADE